MPTRAASPNEIWLAVKQGKVSRRPVSEGPAPTEVSQRELDFLRAE
jgi:hypothetical protein